MVGVGVYDFPRHLGKSRAESSESGSEGLNRFYENAGLFSGHLMQEVLTAVFVLERVGLVRDRPYQHRRSGHRRLFPSPRISSVSEFQRRSKWALKSRPCDCRTAGI